MIFKFMIEGENMKDIDVQKLDKFMSIEEVESVEMKWLSPMEAPFVITGFPWLEKDKVYRRMPLKPNYEITENVELLSDCTSGGQIRFKTDSNEIHIKVKLAGVANMNHMPATGQCGFDCYIRFQSNNELNYCNTTTYDHSKREYQCQLYKNHESILKEVVLNFPLYQGVEEVLIGIKNESSIYEPEKFKYDKKIVFYGTSITQGGCASRPGMSYTNILSRKLDANCINLGFSGSGCGEPALAHIISEIQDVGCLILDYEPNCVSTELFKITLPNFIKIFRDKHKTIPVLVVSRPPYAQDRFDQEALIARTERCEFQKNLVNCLRENGDSNTHFMDLGEALGENFQECTVDGEHPTDLGFSLIAEKLYPFIKDIIFNKRQQYIK
jgi:hypothetical protein